MGGGASKSSVSLAVKPLNALKLSKEQHTSRFQGIEGEACIFVRRGCSLEFSFDVPKKPEGKVEYLAELQDKKSPSDSFKLDCSAQITGPNQCNISVEIPVDFPIGNFKCTFVNEKNTENKEGARISVPHTIFVLFNPQHAKDAVHMGNASLLDDCLLRSETAIIVGTTKHTSKRFWATNHTESKVLKACLLLAKEAPKSAKVNPSAFCKFVVESTMRHLSGYIDSIRKERERDSRIGCVQSTKVLLSSGLEEYLMKKIDKIDLGARKASIESLSLESRSSHSDPDPDDIAFADEMSLLKLSQHDYVWVLAGFTISILRSIGIPCRPVTIFNYTHSPGRPILKTGGGEDRDAISPGPSGKSTASIGSGKDNHPLLRPFDVMLEVWLNEEWHVARAEIDHEGQLRTFVDPLSQVPNLIADRSDPALHFSSNEGIEGVIRQRSSVWTCLGDQSLLEDRTKFYKAVLKPESTIPIKDRKGISISLEGSGCIGDSVQIHIAGMEKGYHVEYSVTLDAISSNGKHRKRITTYSGSKSTPFSAEREVEFDDLKQSCAKSISIIECVCKCKVTKSDVVEALSPMGETDGHHGEFESVVLYDSLAFAPSALVLRYNHGSSHGQYLPNIALSDRLKLETPKLKTMLINIGGGRKESFVPDTEEGRRKVIGFKWLNDLEYSQLLQVLDELDRFVNIGNKSRIAEGQFPWVLTLFDVKQPASRRVTVISDEIEPHI